MKPNTTERSGGEGARGGTVATALAALAGLALLAGAPQAGASACSSSFDHTESECLHAWWDNTPDWTTGVAGGSTIGLRNYCSKYGGMIAKVWFTNRPATSDPTKQYAWSHGNKRRDSFPDKDVSRVGCCIGSDICYKQQVEPKNGEIKINTGDEYILRNVSTHPRRWQVCQAFPDSLYCKINPEGDAFEQPNCGDHYCTVDDCKWHFEQSDAFATCQGRNGGTPPEYKISSSSGSSQTCTVTAECKAYAMAEPGQFAYGTKRVHAEVWDTDEIVNCATVGENFRQDGNHQLALSEADC